MWVFAPAEKVDVTSSRVVSVEVTDARLRDVTRRVPVTRISDLTPLDRSGLPVVLATTPLARDLTTHLGKGPDCTSARVSAVMEAIERVSAEQVDRTRVRRATFESLVGMEVEPIDPEAFDLPPESSYSPDLQLDWVEARELLADREVLVPVDLLISPPEEGVLADVDTNGLAAGNTLLEATVHAVCEVVERDADAQLEFTTLFSGGDGGSPVLRLLRGETLPPDACEARQALIECGLHVVVQYVESDIHIPTFRTVLYEPAYPGRTEWSPRVFEGWGTSASTQCALLRSIHEAAQSRLGFIQGSRDEFNYKPRATASSLRDQLDRDLAGIPIAFDAIHSFETTDLLDELVYLLEQLARAEVRQVVVSELTRPDLGIPVVRVRIAGLASFSVNRRRVGWRCLRHLV